MSDDVLPLPFLPPEVDLRDFAFMPIDIVRLFGSEFHANATDAEWRAGVTLWLKSYHQVPSASLPDDDVALARLAELGRDVKCWRKLKAGALRGWVKCSDGRLYHEVVGEKAADGWNRKQQHQWKRECDRTRKENKVREEKQQPALPMPGKPADLVKISEGRHTTFRRKVPDVLPETPPHSDGNQPEIQRNEGQIPLENGLKGQGQGQGQGQGTISSVLTDSIAAPDGKPASAADPPPDPEADFFRRCRQVLGRTSGGQGARLKAHFGGNIAKARAAIETASTKHDAREYIGALLAKPARERVDGLPYDPSL